MNLSVKHLRQNEYSRTEEEVPEGAQYGAWYVVEHTRAGWFPWPARYSTRDEAERARDRAIERGRP